MRPPKTLIHPLTTGLPPTLPFPCPWALPPQHPPHNSPHPLSLTPQGRHSNSSSVVGCSSVQHPNPAPLVHTAERASCPAWPGRRDPSSVRLPSAEEQVETSGRQERRSWEAPTGRGREAPLPWWQWQRRTGGRPRMCRLLLRGPGPWARDSPGDKLNKHTVEGRALPTCVGVALGRGGLSCPLSPDRP